MKSLDEFIAQAEAENVQLRTNPQAPELKSADADALFHTPLLALSILLIARAQGSDLKISEIATWTGAVLAFHFNETSSLRWNAQWSLPLRSRCADALVFLENVGLISVEGTPTRTVKVSESGAKFIQRIIKAPNDIGLLARSLLRTHSQVLVKGIQNS